MTRKNGVCGSTRLMTSFGHLDAHTKVVMLACSFMIIKCQLNGSVDVHWSTYTQWFHTSGSTSGRRSS